MLSAAQLCAKSAMPQKSTELHGVAMTTYGMVCAQWRMMYSAAWTCFHAIALDCCSWRGVADAWQWMKAHAPVVHVQQANEDPH